MAQEPGAIDKIVTQLSNFPPKKLLLIGIFLSIMLLIFSLINIFFLDGKATLVFR